MDLGLWTTFIYSTSDVFFVCVDVYVCTCEGVFIVWELVCWIQPSLWIQNYSIPCCLLFPMALFSAPNTLTDPLSFSHMLNNCNLSDFCFDYHSCMSKSLLLHFDNSFHVCLVELIHFQCWPVIPKIILLLTMAVLSFVAGLASLWLPMWHAIKRSPWELLSLTNCMCPWI